MIFFGACEEEVLLPEPRFLSDPSQHPELRSTKKAGVSGSRRIR